MKHGVSATAFRQRQGLFALHESDARSFRMRLRPFPRAILLLIVLAGAAYFFSTSFRGGWSRTETDFPNYYTAARLVREREPLRNFYDWTWFQRQMNFTGTERQLGAYAPQTPLTMLPFVPIAGFAPQTAKRIWLVVNLGLLVGTFWMLSRIARIRFEYVVLLALGGFTSLRTNFVLGQYYVLLLFLLTAAFYLSQTKRQVWSGALAALAFLLKLYGGPLFVYFVAKRRGKAAVAMIAASVVGIAVAIAIFGWADMLFYATRILPRTLEGVPADPYNPGIPVFATFLRRQLLPDAGLNPYPTLNAPWLFFFLQLFWSLAILGFSAVAVNQSEESDDRRSFALFTIALLLVSTSVGSYTYLVLLLPIVLCLADAGLAERIYVVASYVLLNAPLPAARLFPKTWILLALFLFVGRNYWPFITRRTTVFVLAGAGIVAAWRANGAFMQYQRAPDQRQQVVALEKGTLFAAFPTVSHAGLFFQVQTRDRYILRWQHDHKIEDLTFDGHALHPTSPELDGPVHFELVANGHSQPMLFDPRTRRATLSPTAVDRENTSREVTSPDGRMVALVSDRTGTDQIYIRNVANDTWKPLTGGACNNSEPAWELDGKGIIFASDCGRSVGLSVLYRMPVDAIR